MQNLYNCRMNAKKYIDLLEDLIPFIEENYEENVILHQDNAAVHKMQRKHKSAGFD